MHISTRRSAPPRTAARIGQQLNRNLSAYLAAASAAGVGLLALATPAEATVVYTAADTAVPANGTRWLDINNDGVADFVFYQSTFSHAAFLRVEGLSSSKHNQVLYWGFSSRFPAQMSCGEKIPHKDFYYGGGGTMAYVEPAGGGRIKYGGNWRNGSNYLGLVFFKGGNTYYGWASFNVSTKHGVISATLTGYAYEDVPGGSIYAGATCGPTHAGTPKPQPQSAPEKQPATLGLLAYGAQGLAIWRRDQEMQP
jgi:hypothetical protein